MERIHHLQRLMEGEELRASTMLPGMGTGHTETEKAISEGGFVGQPCCHHFTTYPCSQHQAEQLRAMWDFFMASLQPPGATAGLVLLQSRALVGGGPTVSTLSQTQRLDLAPGEVPSISHPRGDVFCLA